MRGIAVSIALVVCLASGRAQTAAPELMGIVTDPSGAAIPGAAVELRGPSGTKNATTDKQGHYEFLSLAPGSYQVRISAKGFSIREQKNLRINRPTAFNAQLAIRAERQVVNVRDNPGSVGTDPASNAGAVLLGQRQLAALSDDPDELAEQLQVLAGPSPGPTGGQIYIDGYLGGNLPPKSAIREIRVNANPFSPEYDRPGFGRIEIFTKPGSDAFRGEVLVQYNNQLLNARNPLLDAPAPPYQSQLYRLNLSGPLKKNKASFTLDAERRQIAENALILATTLDSNLNPLRIGESLSTPLTRTSVTPRIDYTLNPKNTLTIRYQGVFIDQQNQGAGGFNLPARAYNQTQTEDTAQITETAILSPQAINETRFQFMRNTVQNSGNDTTHAIEVLGAFNGGGPTIGNSGTITSEWELTNTSTFTKGSHTLKWGGRVRGTLLTDTSFNNFAGTYTFFTLADYEQGIPSQFSLNAGTPTTSVNQVDAGLFVNDDWRARPNLTLSFGLRYEIQTNIADHADWAPRLGIAWGLDGTANKPAKTVLRAGFGTFYDRIPNVVTLDAQRYNGATQQSYLIENPAFYPAIPSLGVLESSGQPQALEPMYSGIQAPRIYQTSAGIERQINQYARIAANWIDTRGVHLLDARNINTPVDGTYPFGDPAIRLLTESAGLSRLNQLVISPNVSYKGLILFGIYALSYGMDDTSCAPTASYAPAGCTPGDPYNLRADWGPSLYGDVRNRVAIASTIPLGWGIGVMPFVIANSAQPYNITTGLDPEDTGVPEARPSLLPGIAASECEGPNFIYAPAYGCFDLKPAPGSPTIGRNYGRGPATVSLGLRLSRTWSFGGGGESGRMDQNVIPAGASGPPVLPSGGPPAGVFSSATGRKYNLTLSASTLNALNRTNLGPPNGDLSSPWFGQSLGLADLMGHMSGTSTYNRKIDLQLRFAF